MLIRFDVNFTAGDLPLSRHWNLHISSDIVCTLQCWPSFPLKGDSTVKKAWPEESDGCEFDRGC